MIALRLALVFILIAAALPVAADDYPSRTISLVVPFPPGGVADITARPLAPALGRALKGSVVVLNKQGAGGEVGMQFAATSKPDGYTLLLALSSISIIPEAAKVAGRQPGYTVDQFEPLALFSADPTVLLVRAESPWKTAKEFIEDAKKRPGQISYSSSGVHGTLHMAMELLSSAAGIKLKHVPHSGGGPALTALLGGHVDALASGPSAAIGQIKAGKLRPLAGWGEKRLAALPEVPTFRELGYPDAEFYIWAGAFAPRGTPEPILAKLREAMKAAAADPEFKSAMDKAETPIAFKQGEEFRRFFDADAKRLAEGVRKVGKIEPK